MNFLVNGIFAIAGRPIYHHVYIRGECYEIIPKSKGFMWLYEAALPYVEAVFYRTVAVPEVQSLTTLKQNKSPTIKKTSLRNSLMPMCSQSVQLAFRPHC
jgi:hypothetical protein